MHVKQSPQDPGETVHIDWKQPFLISTENKSELFLLCLVLGVSNIFESDIAGHLLSDQHPGHFTISVAVIVLYFLQEVFPYDMLSEMMNSSFGLTEGFVVRVENRGIPKEKGIGGSAALCSSLAASIIACRYSYKHINEEVLFHSAG